MPHSLRSLMAVFLGLLPCLAVAEAGSLFRSDASAGASRALVVAPRALVVAPRALMAAPAGPGAADGGSSLFIGQEGNSFFRPYPVRIRPGTGRVDLVAGGSAVARIRHLIAVAEAGAAGYDAVQHGARVRPPRRPTQMTIAEIDAWIRATPGQPHAIGRYQFIPDTFRRLVAKTGLGGNMAFSPRVQDTMADALLAEAGLNALYRGEIGRHAFMRNLAKIWAGLPLPSGRSYYQGYAGNKATMTWARFDAEMARIFPGR